MFGEEQDPIKTLDAVKAVVEALKPFDSATQGRVLQWAAEMLGVQKPRTLAKPEERERQDEVGFSGTRPDGRFATVADLFAAADPSSDVDRTLVMGYWHQVVKSEPEFDSFSVNAELKQLGHGILNITQAFNALIARRPQLVIQTKKSGTSKQARKRYKLTAAGLQVVDQMIGSANGAAE